MEKPHLYDAIVLDAIFSKMQCQTFGMTEASSIVGGEARLKRLISEGKIQVTKPNRKWFCNAADVLRNVDIRKQVKQKNKSK